MALAEIEAKLLIPINFSRFFVHQLDNAALKAKGLRMEALALCIGAPLGGNADQRATEFYLNLTPAQKLDVCPKAGDAPQGHHHYCPDLHYVGYLAGIG